MHTVDLNCDLGEGCSHDAELMALISSANIACGFHAGDLDTMRRTVDLAIEHDVAIGAHPGYKDPANFGRRDLQMSPGSIKDIVLDQIAALADAAAASGVSLSHVKPHGALYNQAARDPAIAAEIAAAVAEFDASLRLFGLSGSASITEARKAGLAAVSEVFADRAYTADGKLAPRSEPNAMIGDSRVAAEQAVAMVTEGRVRSLEGNSVRVNADSICIHGDGPNAVEFAVKIRRRLVENRVTIARP